MKDIRGSYSRCTLVCRGNNTSCLKSWLDILELPKNKSTQPHNRAYTSPRAHPDRPLFKSLICQILICQQKQYYLPAPDVSWQRNVCVSLTDQGFNLTFFKAELQDTTAKQLWMQRQLLYKLSYSLPWRTIKIQ